VICSTDAAQRALKYRVVNPSTGVELNLSEFEIAAEYAVRDS
jgi:hypothetical protein